MTELANSLSLRESRTGFRELPDLLKEDPTMRRKIHRAFPLLLLLIVIGGSPTALAVDTSDTSFLHEPAIGSGRIVFVYADDPFYHHPCLWRKPAPISRHNQRSRDILRPRD
jgi:hypothetical protein